jgi:mono/diheme cytochrome c family protein
VLCSDDTGGVHGAPLTTTTLSLAELMATIGNGRGEMPAFGGAMKPEDLHDVAAFILDRLVDQRDAE